MADPTIIEAAICDERWFGDGGPNWERCPTSASAVDDRRKQIKRLRRFAANFPGADATAERLLACRPNFRCLSGACPECLRATQRWFVARVSKVARDSNSEVLALSLVLPDPPSLPSILRMSDAAILKRKARQAFDDSAAVKWAALAIDVSLNDCTQRSLGSFWQVQLYGFVAVSDKDQLVDLLRARFPTSETVTRPHYFSDYDRTKYGTSYGFKTDFVRRVSYWDFNRDAPCWNTNPFSLKAREHVELLIALDQAGLQSRLLFYHLNVSVTDTGVMISAVD